MFLFVAFDIMSNAILNRICNDESDPMLGVKIYCKHGDLLSMKSSWSKDNPGRRFWSCPRYRVRTFLHLSLETSLYFLLLFKFICDMYFKRMHATFLDGGIMKMLIYDPSSVFWHWRTKLRSWKLMMKVILKEITNGWWWRRRRTPNVVTTRS